LTVLHRDGYVEIGSGGDPIDFMNWSFPLFRIFGIEIRMHWFMVLMIGILVVQAAPEGRSCSASWRPVSSS
jgi:hypothetical protein